MNGNLKTIITTIAAAAIIGMGSMVFGKLDEVAKKLHLMEIKLTEDIGNVNLQIIQYHAMLGSQQKEIDRIDSRVTYIEKRTKYE